MHVKKWLLPKQLDARLLTFFLGFKSARAGLCSAHFEGATCFFYSIFARMPRNFGCPWWGSSFQSLQSFQIVPIIVSRTITSQDPQIKCGDPFRCLEKIEIPFVTFTANIWMTCDRYKQRPSVVSNQSTHQKHSLNMSQPSRQRDIFQGFSSS